MKTNRFLRLTPILLTFLLVGCGSQGPSTQTADDQQTSEIEAGHEGHNHGPGEHAQSAVAVSEEATADWCAVHAVPESECTQCDPSLVAGFKESGDWCAGHDLPESHCRLCNPGIVFPQEELLRASSIKLVEDEINVSLNYRPNAEICATDGALIQFASAATASRAGVSVQAVQSAQLETTDEAPAEILFDETAMAAITTSVSALVTTWLVSAGETVTKGEALAILQSPEIGGLRSALISANAAYEIEQKELTRHSQMRKRDLISEADWDVQAAKTEQARAEFVSARSELLSVGLDESDLNDILEHGSLSNQFALRAPMEGVVIDRVAKLGDLQEAGRAFATIGDPRAMWIEARLTEEQIRAVGVGHQLTFSSDGRGMNRVGGEIIWVSHFLDPHTRTGTVRARVLNPDHSLRAGEFGRVRIVNQESGEVALVPRDAVQWEGCCNVVFVKEAVDLYRPRRVQLIGSDGPFYQLSSGVRPGEEVVVDGAFLLKTELKKTSIGAGCCGLDPVG